MLSLSLSLKNTHSHNLAFFPTWQITREKNTQESKNLIKSRWTFVRVEEDEEEKNVAAALKQKQQKKSSSRLDQIFDGGR